MVKSPSPRSTRSSRAIRDLPALRARLVRKVVGSFEAVVADTSGPACTRRAEASLSSTVRPDGSGQEAVVGRHGAQHPERCERDVERSALVTAARDLDDEYRQVDPEPNGAETLEHH